MVAFFLVVVESRVIVMVFSDTDFHQGFKECRCEDFFLVIL